ncbi:hypothetical protein A6M27_20140 [Acidithiobacillus thiooxidans]|nr:hypothetical protein A6O24_12770 [Acidithiobacillus thiooxidans]OCX77674.1 hypothetical protein A6O26_19395 [Acidithiobacillus thiooxidans]OCX81082.1 hypothetical protein A6M27_20140 [Acidithiobacillus thiooxidans]OFC50207.1 hypothetical protein BAE47_02610 [Acidithiobacillus thiooxidans]
MVLVTVFLEAPAQGTPPKGRSGFSLVCPEGFTANGHTGPGGTAGARSRVIGRGGRVLVGVAQDQREQQTTDKKEFQHSQISRVDDF